MELLVRRRPWCVTDTADVCHRGSDPHAATRIGSRSGKTERPISRSRTRRYSNSSSTSWAPGWRRIPTVPVAHLRKDPSKAGPFLVLQRESLPGGLARSLSSLLEGPPLLIRSLPHKPALHLSNRKGTNNRSALASGVVRTTNRRDAGFPCGPGRPRVRSIPYCPGVLIAPMAGLTPDASPASLSISASAPQPASAQLAPSTFSRDVWGLGGTEGRS